MVISKTPLRVSFAGGGTDLKVFYSHDDGEVISSAIDKCVYIIVKERFDDLIYINYSNKERVTSVKQIKHDLVRESMVLTGVEKGVEITTLADIPSEGSGLGSSSSVTVGLLNALYAYKGEQVSAETLARQACHIEIDLLGKPIGKQDQYIAAYGGIKYFKFKWNEDVEVESIRLTSEIYRQLGSNFLLFYTGKTRDANSVLAEQSQNTKEKYQHLKNIRNHARMIKEALILSNIDQVGEILKQTWEDKKCLVKKISNSEIDEMYQKALDAGALGGKISGAGAGGFLLLYVQREYQNQVRKALREYRELPFFLERHGSKIIFDYRSYPWK